MVKQIVLNSAVLVFFLFTSYSAFSCNTYNGIPISPETLPPFVKNVPNTIAQTWIEDNTGFLAFLACSPWPLSDWAKKHEQAERLMHKSGIKNHSRNNYIFQIPNSTYWIKISGPKHRVRNLYTYNTGKNSYEYTEILKHWELYNAALLDSFKVIPTYQTISRYANYLLLIQAIKNFDLQYITIATTFLVHISGNSTAMCDENYIIVQKHLKGLERLCDVPYRIHNVAAQAIEELYTLISQTGFWDIKYNLLIDKHNNFVLVDHEQRNIENPADFFNNNFESFAQCVLNGFKELNEFTENL